MPIIILWVATIIPSLYMKTPCSNLQNWIQGVGRVDGDHTSIVFSKYNIFHTVCGLKLLWINKDTRWMYVSQHFCPKHTKRTLKTVKIKIFCWLLLYRNGNQHFSESFNEVYKKKICCSFPKFLLSKGSKCSNTRMPCSDWNALAKHFLYRVYVICK